MQIIFAPWRYSYVSAADEQSECIFCRIVSDSDDDSNLVLLRAFRNIVVLNRFPYTTGHLMIASYRHLADPCEAEPEELAEMMRLCTISIDVLRHHYSPHGFNIGMNIGRVAGAGVEHHFHLHVVPRWSGDNSFVSVLGQARVIPEELADSIKRLRPDFADRHKK